MNALTLKPPILISPSLTKDGPSFELSYQAQVRMDRLSPYLPAIARKDGDVLPP